MKIIVAPDSFKGSLSAIQATEAIERGIRKSFTRPGNTRYDMNSDVEIIKVPMADGGEGTVEATIAAAGGKIVRTPALDPLGRQIDSFFGILLDNTAVIEMAASSGLGLLKEQEKDPLKATTFGTGQLIRAALDAGCKKIIIGIGGSATNDGGVGMAQALGVKFTDEQDNEIGFGGGEIAKLAKIDVSMMDSRAKGVDFILASDVKNPLCGPDGASAIYGPQKGATPEMVKILDANLKHLAEIIKKDVGKDIIDVPGSGAAGGLGASLITFLNAVMHPGIDIVMELSNFEDKVKSADVIITGEGSTDYQTMYGKVPFGVAKVAKKYGKPVICISGSLGEGYERLYDEGITASFSIVNRPMTLREAMERGNSLLEKIAENVFKVYLLLGVYLF